MNDGGLIGEFSVNNLISLKASEKSLLSLDINGNISEVEGATGVTKKKSKIPNFTKISSNKLYAKIDAINSSVQVSDQSPSGTDQNRQSKIFDIRTGKLIYEASGYCDDHEISLDRKTFIKASASSKSEWCYNDFAVLDIKSGEKLLSISWGDSRKNPPKFINKYGDILASPNVPTDSCFARGFSIYSISN